MKKYENFIVSILIRQRTLALVIVEILTYKYFKFAKKSIFNAKSNTFPVFRYKKRQVDGLAFSVPISLGLPIIFVFH